MKKTAIFLIVVVLFTVACSTKSTKRSSVSASTSSSDHELLYVKCNGRILRITDIVVPIAKNLTSQKIPYAQTPSGEWRDCSGNFLRFSSYVAGVCPDQAVNLAAPAGIVEYRRHGRNKAPGIPKARTSVALAEWYKKQGRFTPIFYDGVSSVSEASTSLKLNRNNLRVGSVLWFSRKPAYSKRGVRSLISSINHMSVVTEVQKDSGGNVVSFKMYHGRSKGKYAAITHQHYWLWPKAYRSGGKQYPPFGYWRQYLVGIGPLLPEA